MKYLWKCLIVILYMNVAYSQDGLYHIANNVFWEIPNTSKNKERVRFNSVENGRDFEYIQLEYLTDSIRVYNYCWFSSSTERIPQKIKSAKEAGKTKEEIDSIWLVEIKIFAKYTRFTHGVFDHVEWIKSSERPYSKHLYVDVLTAQVQKIEVPKKFLFWELSCKNKKEVTRHLLECKRYLMVDSVLYVFTVSARHSVQCLKNYKRGSWRKLRRCLERNLHGRLKKQFDHFVNGIVIKEEEEEE